MPNPLRSKEYRSLDKSLYFGTRTHAFFYYEHVDNLRTEQSLFSFVEKILRREISYKQMNVSESFEECRVPIHFHTQVHRVARVENKLVNVRVVYAGGLSGIVSKEVSETVYDTKDIVLIDKIDVPFLLQDFRAQFPFLFTMTNYLGETLEQIARNWKYDHQIQLFNEALDSSNFSSYEDYAHEIEELVDAGCEARKKRVLKLKQNSELRNDTLSEWKTRLIPLSYINEWEKEDLESQITIIRNDYLDLIHLDKLVQLPTTESQNKQILLNLLSALTPQIYLDKAYSSAFINFKKLESEIESIKENKKDNPGIAALRKAAEAIYDRPIEGLHFIKEALDHLANVKKNINRISLIEAELNNLRAQISAPNIILAYKNWIEKIDNFQSAYDLVEDEQAFLKFDVAYQEMVNAMSKDLKNNSDFLCYLNLLTKLEANQEFPFQPGEWVRTLLDVALTIKNSNESPNLDLIKQRYDLISVFERTIKNNALVITQHCIQQPNNSIRKAGFESLLTIVENCYQQGRYAFPFGNIMDVVIAQLLSLDKYARDIAKLQVVNTDESKDRISKLNEKLVKLYGYFSKVKIEELQTVSDHFIDQIETLQEKIQVAQIKNQKISTRSQNLNLANLDQEEFSELVSYCVLNDRPILKAAIESGSIVSVKAVLCTRQILLTENEIHPAFLAIQNGDLRMITQLIAYFPVDPIATVDENGHTLLESAILKNDSQMAEYFLTQLNIQLNKPEANNPQQFSDDIVHMRKLLNYIDSRANGPQYKRSLTLFGHVFNFGYSKDEKLQATACLKSVVFTNAPKENLQPYEAILKNRALGDCYESLRARI